MDDPAVLLDHGTVPGSQNTLYLTTDGASIIYSGAAGTIPQAHNGPDIYRVEPGGTSELLYRSPRRDSDLIPVAAADGWTAFGEGNIAAFGEKAWVLWLLPPGASEPIELDRNPPGNESDLPLVAVNGRHVVWQSIGYGPTRERAQLIDVDLPSMTRRVIEDGMPKEYQWWQPSLDGDRLVYGEVDYVHGDPNDQFQIAVLSVKLLDLADPSAVPIRLDQSGRAADPDIHGDTVVWKESDDVFVRGTLTVMDLVTRTPQLVPVTPLPAISDPSVGNRFVATWVPDDTKFYLYDRKRHRMVRIFETAPTSDQGATRPEVAGDLLVWVQSAGTDGIEIAWGRLPTWDDP